MQLDIRETVKSLNKMSVMHRIFIHRAALANGLFLGQLPLLEYVQDHGECTQVELAAALQVSAPSIATSVRRMQKAGLIGKERSAKDSRSNRISITEKGIQIAEKTRAAFDEIDARMFLGFSAAESAAMREYIARMIENITTEEFQGKTMFSVLNTMKAESERDRQKEKERTHA